LNGACHDGDFRDSSIAEYFARKLARMEDLREKVYECNLAIEAHMIVDLLARAGISARTDGEFLAGAGGDLPVGNTIKVRVDPSRAVEARAVIDEWERTQPSDPTPPLRRPPYRSPLWFVVGAACGFGIAIAAFRAMPSDEALDYDGDGRLDAVAHKRHGELVWVEIYDEAGHAVVARQKYDQGRLVSITLYRDAEGEFNETIAIDRFGLPK
jgi:hypothetical protein